MPRIRSHLLGALIEAILGSQESPSRRAAVAAVAAAAAALHAGQRPKAANKGTPRGQRKLRRTNQKVMAS